MSHRCQLSKKGGLAGNRVSHSNRKTRHVQHTNLKLKRLYDPETGQYFRLRVSTRTMRTLSKLGGLTPYLRKRFKKAG